MHGKNVKFKSGIQIKVLVIYQPIGNLSWKTSLWFSVLNKSIKVDQFQVQWYRKKKKKHLKSKVILMFDFKTIPNF